MKKSVLLLTFILTIFQGFSQTKGISYQAVILNPEAQEIPGVNVQGNILTNTNVGIQFTIIDASGNEEYQESHTTSTDKYGMLNLLIGTGNPSSSTNFSEIVWDGTTKKLKVAIDFSGGSNYSLLSEQNLTYMPQPPTEQVSIAIETNTETLINETIRATTAEGVNATAISTLQTEQTTQNTAIALNTAKTGITVQQASDITTNNAKVSDVNHVTSSTTDNLTEGTTNLYYTEARVSANTAVAANTAKTGITPAQAATIAATSGTNTGDQNISGIATNATAISTLQTEQTTQNTAIALNTAKTGITAQQASDITANTAKISVPTGGVIGDIIYNNGTDWVRLPKGTAGQALAINAGATALEWVTISANVNVIQVSLTATISPSNAAPVSFNETLFSKGIDLSLQVDGTVAGLKAGRTYKITAHISGRGTVTGGAFYNIYDYTSNAIIGETLDFLSNGFVYTYSQNPSGISYITPTVDTAIGLRAASSGASYSIGSFTTFTVEEVR